MLKWESETKTVRTSPGRGFSFSERGKTSKKEFGYKSVIKPSKLDIKKDNKKGPEGPILCSN
tara:strand:- start:28 stop:213 length:186 start_codon:yes stop_codon:yes gene_type:complete